GGSKPYSTIVTDGTNNYYPTANTSIYHNLPAGNYTITVSDAGQNTPVIRNVEITQPDVLTANLSKEDPICYFEHNTDTRLLGRAWFEEGSVSGGTGPYTYEWNDA